MQSTECAVISRLLVQKITHDINRRTLEVGELRGGIRGFSLVAFPKKGVMSRVEPTKAHAYALIDAARKLFAQCSLTWGTPV